MIFINQSIGTLSNDILRDFINNNEHILIITSNNIEEKFESENIQYKFCISYKKRNFVLRFFSWLIFSIQAYYFVYLYRKKHTEIFLVSNPPFVFFLSLLFNNHIFYLLVYDLYPDILKIYFKRDFLNLFQLWEKLNFKIFNKAKIIFTIGENMKNAILNYSNSNNVYVINNWGNFTNLDSSTECLYDNQSMYSFLDDKFVFVYAGNFGQTHDFRGIELLLNEFKLREDVYFVFVGEGAKRKELEIYINTIKSVNTIFLERLPQSEFELLLEKSHLGIVTLDYEMGSFSVPSKTFTYLSKQIPILNFSFRDSEVFKFVEKYNIGINFDVDNLSRSISIVNILISSSENFDTLRKTVFNISNEYFSVSNSRQYLKIINSLRG